MGACRSGEREVAVAEAGRATPCGMGKSDRCILKFFTETLVQNGASIACSNLYHTMDMICINLIRVFLPITGKGQSCN